MESGGVRVDMNEARVVVGGGQWRVMQMVVGWPCGVCGGDVGDGSMRCTSCWRWVHRKCGVWGWDVQSDGDIYVWGCVIPVTGAGRAGVDVGDGANLESVNKFCCLGDMLGVDGDAGVENGIRIGWGRFRQLVPLLTDRDMSLRVGGRLCSGCVWSGVLHGSETCLLYTSPSPRDRTRSRMPSSA